MCCWVCVCWVFVCLCGLRFSARLNVIAAFCSWVGWLWAYVLLFIVGLLWWAVGLRLLVWFRWFVLLTFAFLCCGWFYAWFGVVLDLLPFLFLFVVLCLGVVDFLGLACCVVCVCWLFWCCLRCRLIGLSLLYVLNFGLCLFVHLVSFAALILTDLLLLITLLLLTYRLLGWLVWFWACVFGWLFWFALVICLCCWVLCALWFLVVTI